jgi:hypothetical protein
MKCSFVRGSAPERGTPPLPPIEGLNPREARGHRRSSRFRPLAVVATFGLALVGACTSYDPEARIDPAVGQQGDDFFPVALMLVEKCGSIDCHGSKYRNFRLYGYGSQRLDFYGKPNSGETTAAEAIEDYNSLVALEPQLIQQVIREGGREPDRLTFMRKAREHEDHKGGKPITEGDNADICIQSWLQSQVRGDVCRLSVPRLNR